MKHAGGGVLPSLSIMTVAAPIRVLSPVTGFYVSSRAKTEKAKKRVKTSTKGETTDVGRLKKVNADKLTEPHRTSSVSSVEPEIPAEQTDEIVETVSLPAVDRSSVLKACIGTSLGFSAAGLLARQASHLAASSGVEVSDFSLLMPFRTELWHIVPVVGVVAVVTSFRQILLEIWPDFALSTELANGQVLNSLEPLDYVLVACFSGMSEEFLFRGALLPFIGRDWTGIFGAAVVFGVLHRTGGRNSAFAIWASFVGVLYGILGVYTNDLATSMTAHSVSNLLAAVIWKRRQTQK